MRVLLYTRKAFTPTDGIILQGTINILNQTLDNPEYVYLSDINKFQRDTMEIPEDQLELGEIDLIVVPGSPFLWHYYYDTHKIKNLTRLIHKYPKAKVI